MEDEEIIKSKQYIKNLPGTFSDLTYQTLYDIDENEINYGLIVALVRKLVEDSALNGGSILVFLPGIQEIISIQEKLKTSLGSNRLRILPLHSSLPTHDQQRVFERAPSGTIKVILSTSIIFSRVLANV